MFVTSYPTLLYSSHILLSLLPTGHKKHEKYHIKTFLVSITELVSASLPGKWERGRERIFWRKDCCQREDCGAPVWWCCWPGPWPGPPTPSCFWPPSRVGGRWSHTTVTCGQVVHNQTIQNSVRINLIQLSPVRCLPLSILSSTVWCKFYLSTSKLSGRSRSYAATVSSYIIIYNIYIIKIFGLQKWYS